MIDFNNIAEKWQKKWEADKLYVRDDSGDPDLTGVVIEASVRQRCLAFSNKSYLTFGVLTILNSNNFDF